MYKYKSQIEKYDDVYKKDIYSDFDLPDYKIVGEKVVEHKNILTLGGGTGRDIRYLLKNNKVYAVEYSESAIESLKKLGIKTYKADLNNPISDIRTSSMDIAIAKDILEHLERPSTLISEIHRVLKPDGYAVIDVPNHFFLPMRLSILFGHNMIWKTFDHSHEKDFKEWDYMHKIFFTWRGFQEFLKVHKMKIIKNYWDLGTLNHYSQPEMVIRYLENTGKGTIAKFLSIAWLVFNFVFPRKLRSYVVSLSPSLFAASFYVWARPKK